MSYAQAGRLLRIASPLGADVLLLRRLEVREAVGAPFEIVAEVASERDDVAETELVGQGVTCTVALTHRPERHFHGMVRAFTRVGASDRGLTTYRLEAVPRLWWASRTADCRIFQDESVEAIARKVLGEAEVAPVVFGTLPSAPRPYCVQYNETDLEFLSRVLDEVGGGTFFRHAEGDHTLHVTGANADFPAIPGTVLVVRPDAGGPDALTEWRPAHRQRPGKVKALDYDDLNPGTLLETEAATVLPTAGAAATWEVFRWPSGRRVRPDMDPARLEMERAEAAADEVRAQGSDPTVFAGGKLQVKPSLEGAEATWLVTAAQHTAWDETQAAGGGASGYENALTLIPAERPWRGSAPRPRPVVPGLQSAVVTGPAGEEIHCDAHGRIKVHFLWDRAGPRDERSSCYVRVAGPWAGAWGGAWFLPRIGDEVLVGFVDGDPDRPVCLGSLYNDDASKHLYPLPANKTRSWIATRSSKGGSADTANVVRLEDKKGQEEVYVQAERDMNVLVKNARDVTVRDADETLTVKRGHRTTTVETGDDTHAVQKGNIKVTADAGKIEIEAMQSITLTVGSSKITIDQGGVKVEGIKIETAGTAKVDVSAPMITEAGSAMVSITGGLVKINT